MESFSVSSSKSQDQVESGFLLDVVIGKSSSILKLLSSEDKSLLIWRDTLFVLDLSLNVLNGVGRLNVEGDGLAGQSLDEDLHATTQAEDQMEGGLLLDVIVGQGAAILELLASEDETLLLGPDGVLILDLRLDLREGSGLPKTSGAQLRMMSRGTHTSKHLET